MALTTLAQQIFLLNLIKCECSSALHMEPIGILNLCLDIPRDCCQSFSRFLPADVGTCALTPDLYTCVQTQTRANEEMPPPQQTGMFTNEK